MISIAFPSLTGARPAEYADAQQVEIMHVIDRSKERENLLPRYDLPLNQLCLWLGHVFSGILAKEFLFLGETSNRADIGEAVTDHSL
jgi:hypothetical protein